MQFMARRQWRAMRIGDAERERALASLKRHYEDGRLSFEELDERAHAAATARTNGDLERAQRELPALPEPPSLDRQIRLYLIVNALLVLLWSTQSDAGFWPIFPIVIWGLVLAAGSHRRAPKRRALTRP